MKENENNIDYSVGENRAESILTMCDLHIKDMAGKRVLDLGIGPSPIAKIAQKEGIDSVISLDQNLEYLQDKELKQKVVGRALALPFKDKSLDLVIVSASSVIISGDINEIAQEIQEIKRVLKNKGEARFSPPILAKIFTGFIDKEIESLEKSGIPFLAAQNEAEIKLMQLSTELIKKLEPKLVLMESKQAIKTIRENGEIKPYQQYYWLLKKDEK